MLSSKEEVVSASNGLHYDRARQIKAFDDSKAGVKGLLDAGIQEIPQFFVMPPEEICYKKSGSNLQKPQIPIIDLKDIDKDAMRHKEAIREIKQAFEKWDFSRFNEQPTEIKHEFYSRDSSKKIPPNPDELPATCREIIIEYSKQVNKLGLTIFEQLAEGLGPNRDYLLDMDCAKGHYFVCHYYPACPQPDRTLGTSRHCDPDFITILLQDHIGGLQVFYLDQWIDVPPVEGALIVNAGEMLQLITNDKFSSAEHRVVANSAGPRISVACFFSTRLQPLERLYGPIKELLSNDTPPLYRETPLCDYIAYYHAKGLGKSVLPDFKL
ncbi:Isopenicillin N synthase-like, Fe(2+) 2OG dioxygenase domain [Dillenia turbinata]|uniref:Isopenicillin N synthase-like, Fe(2+) 2OG dioxygenase domain n=1 Tax=Dillenia turbinata TaxID=194707 RepID=A0AAN8YSJ9_9MAGN